MKNEYFINKTRTEALSDGIFAIILTLLVLEIKVPHITGDPNSAEELFVALKALLPKIFSWIYSFLVVTVVWVNHHRIFEMLKGISQKLFWANAFILLTASFIPFPTALWGDYPSNPLAVSFYGVVMIFLGLSFYLFRLKIHKNPHWLKDNVSLTVFRSGTNKVLLFGPAMYFLGAIISWYSTTLASLIYLGVAIYFFFPYATKSE
jgi:uncharacterized membrane protein